MTNELGGILELSRKMSHISTLARKRHLRVHRVAAIYLTHSEPQTDRDTVDATHPATSEDAFDV